MRCLAPWCLAAAAAGDAADQITIARAAVLDLVAAAESEGFVVADEGTVSVHDAPTSLLIALSGGDAVVARDLLTMRADELARQIVDALDRLGAADADAAYDIEEAFASPDLKPAATVPAGARAVLPGDLVAGWSVMSQDRIAAQIAALTPEQREALIADFPRQVGNTDGLPWEMRIAANRTNIAQAILDEPDPTAGPSTGRCSARSTIRQVAIAASTARSWRSTRRRSSLVELNGDLATAKSVAVLVPGMNTTIEGSAANTATARRFVAAGRGDVAVLTYLGGPFPRGNLVSGVVDAASPRYALDMAPRLVAFSEDVDRTVDISANAPAGAPVGVTYIGHSYGGSILGTAEAMGLTADQTMYVAAAGAGVGVDDPGDWHNRNPHVLRYSMTAPGDLIQAVQGIPGGPHGADPDEMPSVIHLATGYYDDGRVMGGWGAHSDVLNSPSDSWRNILAVITGDRERIRPAG